MQQRAEILAEPEGSTSNRASSPVWFAILLMISVAIWWVPLRATFALALSDEQFTHILLILPICAVLMLADWNADWKVSAPASPSAAVLPFAVMTIAVLLNVVTRRKAALPSDIQVSTSILALVICWIASFALCFGPRTSRHALYPLCFLLWMVPLPHCVLDRVVSFLQHGSAASAHLFFAAAGIPTAQRGTLLHIPGLTLEVAPECSSIRSSLMLVVTTMVLAHLLLRSTWAKVFVVAVAIPLSVFKNGLRIFMIGVLATRVDRSFLTGRLHRQGGVIFLMIALAVILLLIWILRRCEMGKTSPKARTS